MTPGAFIGYPFQTKELGSHDGSKRDAKVKLCGQVRHTKDVCDT